MITLYACAACGHTVFPARLLCLRCGGAAWTGVPCEEGVVAAVTMVHKGPLGEVRVLADVRVIARLRQNLPTGARVALHEAGDGALWGAEPCA